MSSWSDCIRDIQATIGRKLGDSEIEAIAQAVQVRLAQAKADGLSSREAAKKVGQEMTQEQAEKAMLARRDAANNILVHADAMARISEGNEVKGMKALLDGVSKGGRSNADSITANHHALRDSVLLGPMIDKLRKAGVLKDVQSKDPAFNRDVARELFRRNQKDSIPGTGNKRAETVAGILGDTMDTMRAMQNKAGAWIGKDENYMGRQYHDATKVRGNGSEAAFQAWRDFVATKFDLEKMAKGLTPEEFDKVMKNSWTGISTGIHDSAADPLALAGFTGSANLGKKLSQDRSFIFKDADSWFDYNEKFGKGSVMDAVWSAADGAAHATSVMQKLGTNPEAMYKRINDTLVERAKARGDVEAMRKIAADPNRGLFDTVTGKSSVPGNERLATVASHARSLMQLTHLGSVLISAFPDLVATSATLRANGVPLFQALAGQMRSILPRGEASQEIAHSMGAGINGMAGHIINRFRTEDGIPGKMTDAVNKFHTYNGLNYWTEGQKTGMGLALASNLAYHSAKEFDALPKMMQSTLRQYGIEAAEWDVGRAHAAKAADGHSYIMPGDITDPAISQKFGTYVIDQIREGLNEPTAASRVWTTAGLRAGTPQGEIVRSVMQFKSFTVTYMQRHLGRVLYRDGVDVPGIIYLAAGMALTGYASNTLRDALANKSPRMPTDAMGWADVAKDAMASGGAFGILGDAIFKDSTTKGGDVLRGLVGPLPVAGADAFAALHAITQKAMDGKSHAKSGVADVAAREGLKLLGSNMPNLFYAKAAYTYLFGNVLTEMVTPGAQRRFEKLLKDQGQHQILTPALQK